MYTFSDRKNPVAGVYTAATPIKLSYSVKLADAVTPGTAAAPYTYYSNAFDVDGGGAKTAKTTAVFTPTFDNPYYYYTNSYVGNVDTLANAGYGSGADKDNDISHFVKGTIIGSVAAGTALTNVYITSDMVKAANSPYTQNDVGTVLASVNMPSAGALQDAFKTSLKDCVTATDPGDGVETYAFKSGIPHTHADTAAETTKATNATGTAPYIWSEELSANGKITASLGNNGKLMLTAGITLSGTAGVAAGGTINYTITVYNYTGSNLSNVTVAGNPASGLTNITNTSANGTYVLNGSKPTWSNLTLAPGANTLTFTAKAPSVAAGTVYDSTASITAVGGASISTVSNIVKTTIASGFTINAYVHTSSGGSVSGGGTYSPAASVTLVAVPNSGYKLTGWYTNASCTGQPASTSLNYTFNAVASLDYYAKFERITHTVSASAGTGGTVKLETWDGTSWKTVNTGATASTTVNDGTKIQVTATTIAGYEFSHFIVTGSTGTALNHVYTVDNVTQITTVNASFIATGKVTFDYDGATNKNGADETNSITTGQKIGALPVPDRDGFIFGGWKDEYGDPIDDDTIMPAEGIAAIAVWTPDVTNNPFWVTSNEGFEYGYPTLTDAVNKIASGVYSDKTITMKANANVVNTETLPDGHPLTGAYTLTVGNGDILNIGNAASDCSNDNKNKSWLTGAVVESVTINVTDGTIHVDGQRSSIEKAIKLWPGKVVNFVSDANTGNYFNITLMGSNNSPVTSLTSGQGWAVGATVVINDSSDGDIATKDADDNNFNLYGGRVKITNPGITQYTDWGAGLFLKLMADEGIVAVRLPFDDSTAVTKLNYADPQFVFDYGALDGALFDMSFFSDGTNDNIIYIIANITDDLEISGDSVNNSFTLISATRIAEGEYGTAINIATAGKEPYTLSGNITIRPAAISTRSVWKLDNINVTGTVTMKDDCYISEQVGKSWEVGEKIKITADDPGAQLGAMLVENGDLANYTLVNNEGYALFALNGNLYLGLVQDVPDASIDYIEEKLQGLSPGAVYTITVDGTSQDHTTDAEGKITIPEEWMDDITITIVKKGSGTDADSSPQLIFIPKRPNAPIVTGQGHKIRGVGDTMEYRKSDESDYTSVSSGANEITGLDQTTYYVRVKAKQGSGGNFSGDDTRVRLEVYDIDGNVLDQDSGDGVSGASIELKRGDQIITSTITDENGYYELNNVPDGVYNLVVTSHPDGTVVTTIIKVEGNNVTVGNVMIPAGQKNTVVRLANQQTPNVVVGGLPEQLENIVLNNEKGITQDDLDVVSGSGLTAGALKLELVATGYDETTAPSAGDIISAASGKSVGMFIDLSVFKYLWNNSQNVAGNADVTTQLTELAQIVTIYLPLDTAIQGKASYWVYRYHNGAEALSNSSADEEYFEISADKTIIILHVKKFSTYAVAYTDPAPPKNTSGGGGGGAGAEDTVTVKKDGDQKGAITVTPTQPKSGDKVTVAVKPDAGFEVDMLTVTDANGNAIRFTDNGDGTYTYTQPSGKVTVTATFRNTDDSVNPAGDVSAWLITNEHIAYMFGRPNGKFAPDAKITRAEAAQMLYNLLHDKNATVTASFSDIPSGAWYAKAVNTLASMGIITGYSDGLYHPDEYITRAETATLMNNVLGRYADKAYIDGHPELNLFVDVNKTHWAYDSIMETTNTHDFEKNDKDENWK